MSGLVADRANRAKLAVLSNSVPYGVCYLALVRLTLCNAVPCAAWPLVRGRDCGHHERVSSTPLWVPLVVAGLAVLGTLAGVLVTQRWSDRREASIWTRERQREQERWTREDMARTFEHRREAYVDFYVAVKVLARMAYRHGYGWTDDELPEDWQDDALMKLHRVEFYADRELAVTASEAYGAAWSWGVYGKYNDPDDPDFHERQQKYDDAELEMIGLMRNRLSIPEGDPTLPPPGFVRD